MTPERTPSGADIKKTFQEAAKKVGLRIKGACYLGHDRDTFCALVATPDRREHRVHVPGDRFRKGHIFSF